MHGSILAASIRGAAQSWLKLSTPCSTGTSSQPFALLTSKIWMFIVVHRMTSLTACRPVGGSPEAGHCRN
ncbi:hypothetical protein FOPG_12243 [Fusarium oxysporum f. sp. conglutinans race 2 54008]|uniref:Uncharacterized protein n=1 Tax=Fusarium oxysporum f. sp. conglutinans race 2 54008 TaxID=1089457 RepID=X0HJU5_FUSOX|nr:hypothetical protein FOPG_12243 [Fusarium oxysporum f. sp. conglutinans race 2 54008]